MPDAVIPGRDEIPQEHKWNLSKLFSNDEEWERALGALGAMEEKIPSYRGTLGASAEGLGAWMDFYRDLGLLEERLGYYAMLRQSEDEGDSQARTMMGKFTMAASRVSAASAWADPEIMAIPSDKMESFLAQERLGEYRIYLQKLLRFKPHILSDKEEKILALQSENEDALDNTFSVLTNVDLDFGQIETPEGLRPLSQSSWIVLMENPDRDLRKRTYDAFYGQFDAHKNTLASLYGGSVKQDVIKARIRGYPSARAMALYPDQVGEEIYDNLISTVGQNLGPLHRYYSLRKRVLKVPDLRHYDAYVPLVGGLEKKTTWEEGVDLVCQALSPLGDEYTGVLKEGLLGRWADRYENKGKSSGAFSAGSYAGDPYILMNYKDDSVRDVFTLAHEGGHSMHSYYSARANPFMHYNYTIFEAEVASTFNEELLFRHLLGQEAGQDRQLRLYLVNRRCDEILGTLYRQTMFAEFEARSHQLEEEGKPLTLDVLRLEYRQLLEKYFGPEMVLEEASDLEGLRIPHFYGAFYVYKYSTGISASLALADRVLGGGPRERSDYFGFLSSGGSRFPMESLKMAGVDMGSPEPVAAACRVFEALVKELEELLV